MSGGALNYLYEKVEWTFDDLDRETLTPLQQEFVDKYVPKLIKTLKSIELELSGDTSEGDSDDDIKALMQGDL